MFSHHCCHSWPVSCQSSADVGCTISILQWSPTRNTCHFGIILTNTAIDQPVLDLFVSPWLFIIILNHVHQHQGPTPLKKTGAPSVEDPPKFTSPPFHPLSHGTLHHGHLAGWAAAPPWRSSQKCRCHRPGREKAWLRWRLAPAGDDGWMLMDHGDDAFLTWMFWWFEELVNSRMVEARTGDHILDWW